MAQAQQATPVEEGTGNGLKRELGLLAVFSLAAGAMVSSGLFVLPGIAFSLTGPAVVVSYFLAGVLMIPAMFAQVELATAMPKSGGSYFFIERSLGPLAGTFGGFANWLSIALKSAFALVGIGALGALLLPTSNELTTKFIAIGACVFFGILNTFSVKGSGRFQSVMVVGLLAILAAYIAASVSHVEPSRFQPFMPFGKQSIIAVAGMVFVSYGGLTKVASVAEEVRNPSRNIPWGILLAFVVINLVYLLVVAVTVGVLPDVELRDSLTPITDAARYTMPTSGTAISLAALLAFITTANAGIFSAARSPLAMSRDGLIVQSMSKTNRFGTPHISIIVTCALMIVAIAFLSIENLVKTASTVMIVMFILVNFAVIIMRKSGLQNYRPTFKAPLCPWSQIVGIVAYVFLLFEMGRVPLILTGVFIVATSAWYFIYVHKRVQRESAFVYLVKRVVARQLGGRGLEDELRSIALERDDVEFDRFDHVIKECEVLDLEGPQTFEDVFEKAAAMMAPRVGVDKDRLKEMLFAREKESNTVIDPGLAIPHVIVEGKHVFDILPVRCKEGVVFPDGDFDEPVTTIFFLVGSSDERNFHLTALMSIARIVQETDFKKRWHEAASQEGLRDVILLSSRVRHG